MSTGIGPDTSILFFNLEKTFCCLSSFIQTQYLTFFPIEVRKDIIFLDSFFSIFRHGIKPKNRLFTWRELTFKSPSNHFSFMIYGAKKEYSSRIKSMSDIVKFHPCSPSGTVRKRILSQTLLFAGSLFRFIFLTVNIFLKLVSPVGIEPTLVL